MADIPDIAADKFKHEILALKTMAEDSIKLRKEFSDDFPDFQSAEIAEQYIVNVHAKYRNHALVLQNLIESVKNVSARTLSLKESLSPEDFRSYARNISQIALNYDLDTVIKQAEHAGYQLDTEVTRLKEHAHLYVQRQKNNRDDDVRPPRIDIPPFSGKTEDWLKFWNPFNFAVHYKTTYSKQVKLTILVGKLRGEAAHITDALDISDASYDFAIDKLKEEYGDTALQLKDLGSALKKIASPNYNHVEISEALVKMEMMLKRMNYQLNDENSTLLVSLLEDKFPRKFRETITDISNFAGIKSFTFQSWLESAKRALKSLKEKNAESEWSTHSMQTSADYGNEHRYRSKSPVRSWQPNPRFNNRNDGKFKPQTPRRSRSPGPRQREFSRDRAQSPATSSRTRSPSRADSRSPGRFPSTSRNVPRKAFKHYGNCPYCSRKHAPEACVIGSDEKIALLKEDLKCFACFKSGHSARDCEYGCAKCGSTHHVSCCNVKETNNYLAESVQASTGLMVGAAKVSNSDEMLTFILDTGSDHSYILKDTAEKLELPIIGSQTLMISTFGGNKSIAKQHDIARLTLSDADNNLHTIEVFVVEHIAERVGVAQLNEVDKAFLASRKLTLVNGNHKFANPDLLIGIDYFFDIIDEDMRHIRLPSGLHYIATRHGGLITGSAKKITQALATFQGTSVTHCYSTIANGGSADGGSEERHSTRNSEMQDFRERTALTPQR